MRSVVEFVVAVDVDHEGDLSRAELVAEARSLLDYLCGTYKGSSRWDRSAQATGRAHSTVRSVKVVRK